MFLVGKKNTIKLLVAGVCLSPLVQQALYAEDKTLMAAEIDQELVEGETGSVTIYDTDYLSELTNIVTAYDLAGKVPGGQGILNRSNNNGGGQKSRGFASNDDGVLINGKRLSGKNNSSQGALGRIPAKNVVRIEIIRGSSPDVKVSSQEAFMNVVLSDDVSNGSGTWDIGARIAPQSGRTIPTATVSYGSKLGNLEYFVEVKQVGFVADPTQLDTITDAAGQLEKRISEVGKQYFRRRSISTNLTYNLPNADQIRLNASYETRYMRRTWDGDVSDYLPDGSVAASGNSLQKINLDDPSWEVGGDYETSLGDKWKVKLVGLYAKNSFEFSQREDELITGEAPVYDTDYTFYSNAREAILRPSLTWDIAEGRQLEFGNEVALNRNSAGLDTNNLVTVKETRSESFVNYSWKVSDKVHLDSALKYEYSKISQESIGLNRSETFKFLKPSVDLRYDIDNQNQLQFSVRREVSQLNFDDFATSINDDNIIIAGNENLVPEKSWGLEVSYERRFADDMGQIKLKLAHERISDHIEMIEVSPGVAGSGNIGDATINSAIVTTSLKFGFIGLENVVLDGTFEFYDTGTTDAFTGEKRIIDGRSNINGEATLRHDIDDMGLSYGLEVEYEGQVYRRSIGHMNHFDTTRVYATLFAEYKVFGNMIFSVRANNILDSSGSRVTTYYDPSRASGMISSTEGRIQKWRPRLQLGLKSTF